MSNTNFGTEEKKRKLRSIRAFSRYEEVIRTGVGSVVLWVLPLLSAASTSFGAQWWMACPPFAGGDTGLERSAQRHLLGQWQNQGCDSLSQSLPTLVATRSHCSKRGWAQGSAWVLASALGQSTTEPCVGFLSLPVSFNQLAKEETETKSTQPCQLAVTLQCVSGIMSPLTWHRPRQLHSDIATYFKFKEWSGRKWKGKK